MPKCKKCGSECVVKNGIVRNKQRYLCKECGLNFVIGDERTNASIAAKKALLILLYSMGKISFNMLGKIFKMYPSQVYRWIAKEGHKLPDQPVTGEIKEIEIDEMWHFIEQKKRNFGSSRPLIAAQGELWPGCLAIVILQLSDDCIKSSAI